MANGEQKPERTVTLFVSVRIENVPTSTAQEIEDAIRDIADDYPGAQVSANRDAPRIPPGA